MRSTKLDKLVASNSLSWKRGIMSDLERDGMKNGVLWLILKRECEMIEKRYPSLR